jgi:endonuclease/exonuclease/phosphatase family metal-dependent hydrolase
MRIRLAVALLATVLGLLVGAPAHAGGPPLLTMTFNACGNVCRHGEVDLTTSNIAYQIRARRVGVAMLQELCYSQFLGVRDRLARYGYTAIFATGTKGGHCADYDRQHGRAFGVALIAHGKLSGGVAHRLVSSSPVRPETRMVLAATVRLSGRTVFAATTHTAPSGPNLAGQMNAIDRWLTPAAASRPVLFGGDLNSVPGDSDLDGFYASFDEANGTRTDPLPTFITVPRKIDYLFGSRAYLNRRGAATACGRYSDHCMYFGLFQ